MNSNRHDRAMDVFAVASELDSQERDAYLTRVCGDDVTLRHEVESLLSYHDDETLIDKPRPKPVRATKKLAAIHRIRGGERYYSHPVFIGLLMILVTLLASAVWVHHGVKLSLAVLMTERLQTVLDADITALERWIEDQKAIVSSWAEDSRVQRSVAEIVKRHSRGEAPATDESLSELRSELSQMLGPVIAREGYRGFGVISRDGTFVTGSDGQLAGASMTPTGAAYVSRLNRGEVVFAIPSRERKFVIAVQTTRNDPVLAMAAPVRDSSGRVIGALCFGFDADAACTEVLSLARFGQTGETYAFDKDAVLLSDVRNREELETLGLLQADQQCALNVEIRELPQTSRNGKPVASKAIRPLTHLAAHAIAGHEGTNVAGYRNFAGNKVVGAWKWLPAYDFGVGTEINYAEAYAPLTFIARSFVFLIGAVALLSIGMISSSLKIFQLRKRIAVEQFGSYRLGEKIGEGGMGQVYKAYHNRLQRPAAVKLLTNAAADKDTTARFEREVQLTSTLTHPNTIRIYDFGVSTNGVFYYAMELLDGLTLEQLVQADKTICPARTIYILQQVCGSLQEAHQRGLIHRDIKPSNIMVTQRAGLSDFVTVLDFGIAKPIVPNEDQNVTQSAMVIGTPHFMAPERVLAPETVNARSDVFSLGAVAYYMLVGRRPFEGASSVEVLRQSAVCEGLLPSGASEHEIPVELDQLVFDCLSQDPDSRPQSAIAMKESLDLLATQYEWTQREAKAWWKSR